MRCGDVDAGRESSRGSDIWSSDEKVGSVGREPTRGRVLDR